MTGIGYPDWQRYEVWDEQPLVPFGGNARVGVQQYGYFYVGRFAAIALVVKTTTNPVLLTIDWAPDAGGSFAMGTRDILVSPSTPSTSPIVVLNQGPWVRVTLAPNGAVPWFETFGLYATNRRPLLHQTPPLDSSLLSYQAVNIAAGVTRTDWLRQLFEGPVQVHIESPAVPVQVDVLRLQTVAAVNATIHRRLLAAGGTDNYDVVLPLHSCALAVTNNGGAAGNFWVAIEASGTGSS